MIIPPEKAKDLLDATDGESCETEVPQALLSSPISSSSRAIASPTLPTPENVPPPSYSDHFARPSTLSYFAPTSVTSSATENAPRLASFSRAPSQDVTYPSFPPIFLVATGKTLDKGFPQASPPSNLNPHPFVSHDVNEGDWTSFLEEVRSAAALTDKQVRRSYLPIVSLIPIVNSLASYGVKQIMKHQNISKVILCIDKWNRHFFEQRKIRIVLMKGQVKVSGQTEYLNDATSPSNSRNLEIGDRRKHEDHPSTSSAVGIGQGLIGKDDDVYRLFLVPLS